MPRPGPFADELLALGSIAGHTLVRVLGCGSYGVVLLAEAPADAAAAEGGGGGLSTRTRDATPPKTTSAPAPPQSVVIKVARRPLAPGPDAVWAAHCGEWAALAAVAPVPGAPRGLAAGVLALPPYPPPAPPRPPGFAPPSDASAAAPAPAPRCHAFMTMERLGPDVWAHLGRAAPRAWRCRVFPALADALLDAVAVPHAAGIVHRDVKPENMCLSAAEAGDGDGGGAEASPRAAITIVDYGGATVPGRAVRSRDRLFYGTPLYAGLSTLRGEPPSPWDDLEALGFCYLEMWLGALPWSDEFHSLVDNAPGGKWSIAALEAMADAKEADFAAAVASGAVPWFLIAWFEACAAGRAAAAAAAATGAKGAPAVDDEGVPVHPAHAAPCLRVFKSLVRAGVCQAEAEASMATMGGRGGRPGGRKGWGGADAAEE